jgi:5-methylcytosine-specific restriction endonuclease McrA
MPLAARREAFEALWIAQAGCCAICASLMLRGRAQAPSSAVFRKRQASIDHIIPLSRGGRDVRDNLQLTCRQCNRIKGDSRTAAAPAGVSASAGGPPP